MLSVGLLGGFRVAGSDAHDWHELGPAARKLASFLFTFPDRGHRRERLAELFWPELDAERARRALNSAVWRLRKLLATQSESASEGNLQTFGSETLLTNAPWLDVDIWALQRFAAPILKDPLAPLDPQRLMAITAILHRYEGPFLDGDEGDWILEERERLHSIFVRTATITARGLGTVGLYHQAISLARHALRFDPFREELMRNLLVLLALDEQRYEAVRSYQQWSKLLKDELNVAPLPATRRVLEEIRLLDSGEAFEQLRNKLFAVRL
ncbi:MAG TPA: BTAD domain-containing putative transcriptional regulator [Xanthobacteraceae bacterium]|nr:BTAD domain-containing putative transcriptional regulator [Xanthobacteraceae bacterium]